MISFRLRFLNNPLELALFLGYLQFRRDLKLLTRVSNDFVS